MLVPFTLERSRSMDNRELFVMVKIIVLVISQPLAIVP